MGQGASANTSASGGDSGQSTATASPAKTCYYELLAVPREASQDDIKRAYKKKALELHPDRNYGNVEEATQLFIGIQAAYEVLSDPQERAWYDSHREQILRGGDHIDGGTAATHPVSVTTSEEVLEWFSLFTTTKLSYDDNARSSFYVVLGEAFKKLADEEIVAAEWANEDAVYYPDFGNSKSTHEDWVKQFYTAWGGFRTQKSFSWCDIYRYQDAPDRRVKRIMEKENKKARDSAIREFNETVRSFVLFVRKRDPRFVVNIQSEAQRQATLLAASKEQAARQRKENLAKLKELKGLKAAEWTQVSPEAEDGSDELGKEEDGEGDEGEVVVERYECIVCKKTFGSEGQMNGHEKSKKHIKNVHALKGQMLKENKEFNLDRDVWGVERRDDEPTVTMSEGEVEGEEGEEEKEKEEEGETEVNSEGGDVQREIEKLAITPGIDRGDLSTKETSLPPSPREPDDDKVESEDENADYVSAEKFTQRTFTASAYPPSPPSPTPKIGKAKAKRAKKAAQQQVAKTDDTTCISCRMTFSSNTKMFSHLQENPDHARPIAGGSIGGSTGGGAGGVKGKGKAKKKK